MDVRRLWKAFLSVSLTASVVSLAHCGGPSAALPSSPVVLQSVATATLATASKSRTIPASTRRAHFLGGFFRPEGAPPFGVFSNARTAALFLNATQVLVTNTGHETKAQSKAYDYAASEIICCSFWPTSTMRACRVARALK